MRVSMARDVSLVVGSLPAYLDILRTDKDEWLPDERRDFQPALVGLRGWSTCEQQKLMCVDCM